MNTLKYSPVCFLIGILIAAFGPLQGFAQQASNASKTRLQVAPALRDGQHDFDFHIGTWKTHVSRLLHPLTGSTTWAQYDGTTIVRKVWNGRANLVELEVTNAAGHLELASWRLYNPDTQQWSLNVANSGVGIIGVPTVGGFKDGRGEFYDHETYNGHPIVVRFIISNITRNSAHFEQAFSADDGKTWEVNWIATDTRTKDESDNAQ